ncbi:MAG: TIGR00282 family metallophosphoesterase [Oscillospiraceae bacterium]
MNLLFLGDVVGQSGCDYFLSNLPKLKQKYKVDVCVANGENSAEGNGILPSSATQLFDSGVDVITTGNHVFRRHEIYDMLEENIGIVRPLNMHSTAPGVGYYIFDKLKYKVCVISLMGRIYMEALDNPFDAIDNLLPTIDTPIIIVDFHAEATSEKISMAYHLDSRVSAVIGTHTHVQTADERIFAGGTGYITDAGMCGSMDSVLGIKPELALKKLRTGLPVRFETAKENYKLHGVLLEIDTASGKTTKISRIAY